MFVFLRQKVAIHRLQESLMQVFIRRLFAFPCPPTSTVYSTSNSIMAGRISDHEILNINSQIRRMLYSLVPYRNCYSPPLGHSANHPPTLYQVFFQLTSAHALVHGERSALPRNSASECWSGRDSNPRPPAQQSSALVAENSPNVA